MAIAFSCPLLEKHYTILVQDLRHTMKTQKVIIGLPFLQVLGIVPIFMPIINNLAKRMNQRMILLQKM